MQAGIAPFSLGVLKSFGVELHGWYVESAEGVLTPFVDDPEETVELSERMDEAAAASHD